jgi:hypothetical protein
MNAPNPYESPEQGGTEPGQPNRPLSPGRQMLSFLPLTFGILAAAIAVVGVVVLLDKTTRAQLAHEERIVVPIATAIALGLFPVDVAHSQVGAIPPCPFPAAFNSPSARCSC